MDPSVADVVVFCERSIDGMRAALDRLDDETVNAQPPLPAPNSPYQLMNHALSAAVWWADHIICGNPSDRDRAGEFESAGTVAQLRAQADAAVATLRALQPDLEAATALAETARTSIPLEADWTVGTALIHIYEELAQHLGHLEITVDLVADAAGV
ncbi:MAG: DinB family protein [Actinomycetota bacterium]